MQSYQLMILIRQQTTLTKIVIDKPQTMIHRPADAAVSACGKSRNKGTTLGPFPNSKGANRSSNLLLDSPSGSL